MFRTIDEAGPASGLAVRSSGRSWRRPAWPRRSRTRSRRRRQRPRSRTGCAAHRQRAAEQRAASSARVPVTAAYLLTRGHLRRFHSAVAVVPASRSGVRACNSARSTTRADAHFGHRLLVARLLEAAVQARGARRVGTDEGRGGCGRKAGDKASAGVRIGVRVIEVDRLEPLVELASRCEHHLAVQGPPARSDRATKSIRRTVRRDRPRRWPRQ